MNKGVDLGDDEREEMDAIGYPCIIEVRTWDQVWIMVVRGGCLWV